MNRNQKFISSAGKGNYEMVEYFLKFTNIDPTINKNEAIIVSSRNGHLDVVELLLSDSRVDPSSNGNEAIRFASENGHLEVVKLLLSDARVLSKIFFTDTNKIYKKCRDILIKFHKKMNKSNWPIFLLKRPFAIHLHKSS